MMISIIFWITTSHSCAISTASEAMVQFRSDCHVVSHFNSDFHRDVYIVYRTIHSQYHQGLMLCIYIYIVLGKL